MIDINSQINDTHPDSCFARTTFVFMWLRNTIAPESTYCEGENMENQAELSNHLLSLEKRLLMRGIRKSGEELEELLSDDFIEIRSTGVLADKKKSIMELKNQPLTRYELSDFCCKVLSSDVALTRYRIKKSGSYLREKVYTIRTSIWKRINNKWKMVLHQGTIYRK